LKTEEEQFLYVKANIKMFYLCYEKRAIMVYLAALMMNRRELSFYFPLFIIWLVSVLIIYKLYFAVEKKNQHLMTVKQLSPLYLV